MLLSQPTIYKDSASVLISLVNSDISDSVESIKPLKSRDFRLRQQAAEMHKRKAVESAQTAADLKLHLDKYHSQLKDAQVTVADKTSALQQETFRHKRLLVSYALICNCRKS